MEAKEKRRFWGRRWSFNIFRLLNGIVKLFADLPCFIRVSVISGVEVDAGSRFIGSSVSCSKSSRFKVVLFGLLLARLLELIRPSGRLSNSPLRSESPWLWST